MRRLTQLNLWSIATLAGVASSAALAQSLPLSTLNGGPSAGSVPTVDDSTVATFAFPREVVDTTVTTVPSGTLAGTAGANSSLTVQTTAGGGFRNRSRAVVTNALDTNAAARLQLIANSNGAGVAANSFIFIGRSSDIGTGATQIGQSITSLLTFIGSNTEGVQFFQIPFGAVDAIDADAEITEALLNAGVDIPYLGTIGAAGIFDADPDAGGPLTGAAFRFNSQFDVMCFAIDAGGTSDPEVVTEFVNIRRSGILQTIATAATGTSDTQINDIRVLAGQQQVDDFTGAGGNPGDLTVANLNATDDFLIATDAAGTGAQSLFNFIQNTTLMPGGPYTIASFSLDGTGTADFNRILILDISPNVTDATAIANLRSRFISYTPTPGGEVYAVTGGNPGQVYSQLAQAGDITITNARLLNGSGRTGNNVWVAVDFSANITDEGTGNQLELVATVDGDELVIATGTDVQFAVPSVGDVPGILDANLSVTPDGLGTDTDVVIATAPNRLFFELFLNDVGDGGPDDAINSDATWSDNGTLNFRNRATRHTFVARNSGNGTPASNALGSALGDDVEFAVSDLSRPINIRNVTRNRGTNDPLDLCEVVDQIDIIFDETVQTLTQNRVAVRFNGGIEIDDLSAGLTGQLELRQADVVAAPTFASSLLSTGTSGLITNFISNDTINFTAPLLAIVGAAADGTSTTLRPGTGFVGGDAPYKVAIDANAIVTSVSAGGSNLGNIITTGATFASGALTAGGEDLFDGSSPSLVASNATDTGGVSGDLDFINTGYSENSVDFITPTTTEAESYFFIMVDEEFGRLHNMTSAPGNQFATVEDDEGPNQLQIFLTGNGSFELDGGTAEDPGYVIANYNPGFPIADSAGNRIDPVTAKTKMVPIGRPSAVFKEMGIGEVDPVTDKVVTILARVTGAVDINTGGDIDELDGRFYVRGGTDNNGSGIIGDAPGEATGEPQTLDGLIDSIEISDTPDSDGCYVLTITLVEDCPMPQENFILEYVDPDDQSAPGTWLVDATQTASTIPSALVTIKVLRAPVVEGDPTPSGGNILTMTIAGTLRLGADENALGSEIKAYAWKALGDCGTLTFTYKGVVHTVELDTLSSGSEAIVDGTVLYFHPQLKGEEDEKGTVFPCGVINNCPDYDLYQIIELNNDGDDYELPLYQNLNPAFAVAPIALTFRAVTTAGGLGNFTVTGTGISNATFTTNGRFEFIGRTIVTGAADSNNARPYTLHTSGEKSLRGCRVVLVVCPEDFFTDLPSNLANNLLVNPIIFLSDIDSRMTAVGPDIININYDNIWAQHVSALTFGDWGLFPWTSRGDGRDFGASAPNRFRTSSGEVNTFVAIPTGVDARGFFIFINRSSCVPIMADISMALVVDSRGVYCASLRGLDRIVAGYSYALQFGDGVNSAWWWNTFGALLSSTPGGFLVTTNGTNGGWTTTANLRNSTVTANSLVGQIAITLNSDGVRIGGDGVASQFADLIDVESGQAVLINQTETSVNNPAN